MGACLRPKAPSLLAARRSPPRSTPAAAAARRAASSTKADAANAGNFFRAAPAVPAALPTLTRLPGAEIPHLQSTHVPVHLYETTVDIAGRDVTPGRVR
jgi:hypothetical protein